MLSMRGIAALMAGTSLWAQAVNAQAVYAHYMVRLLL